MKKKTTKRQSDALSEPLVAFDFGSYDIKAMAAEYNPDEPLHILGVERTDRHHSIRNGIINDTSETGFNIRNMLIKLSNRLSSISELPSAFVSLGGKSMQLARIPAKRNLGRRLTVSKAVMEGMENECKEKIRLAYQSKDLEVIDIKPYEFILDGELQYEAPTKEQKVQNLEIHYVAFVANTAINYNLMASFARSGVVIENMWIRPLAHLTALTTDEEQSLGCAILDLGDQTTTLSIVKDHHFIYSKVIPIGADNITRDIQQQGISMENARKLKHLYGYAEEKAVPKNQNISIPSEQEPKTYVKMTTTFLAMIIRSRLNEIITPLFNDLNNRFKDDVTKLYITGGGAMLKGIKEYLQSLTEVEVEYGSHADWLDEETPKEYYAPEYSALVGTLILADESRQSGNNPKQQGPIQPDSFWIRMKEKIERKVVTLFDDETTNN